MKPGDKVTVTMRFKDKKAKSVRTGKYLGEYPSFHLIDLGTYRVTVLKQDIVTGEAEVKVKA